MRRPAPASPPDRCRRVLSDYSWPSSRPRVLGLLLAVGVAVFLLAVVRLALRPTIPAGVAARLPLFTDPAISFPTHMDPFNLANGVGSAPGPASAMTLVLVASADDIDHATLLVTSLRKFLVARGVHEMLIVAPDSDVPVFATLASALPVRGRVLPDSHLLALPVLPSRSALFPGYATQMLLKLLVARLVHTEFYLVLDTDVLLAGELSVARDLVREGNKTLFEPEPRSVHAGWWAGSLATLQLDDDGSCIPRSLDAPLFGATPAVLSRTIASRVVRSLQRVYGADAWLNALYDSYRNGPGWTEYTLYRIVAGCPDEGALFGVFYATPSAPPSAALRNLLGPGCCVWEEADWATFNPAAAFSPGRTHLFLVLQSRAGSSLRNVLKLVAPFLA